MYCLTCSPEEDEKVLSEHVKARAFSYSHAILRPTRSDHLAARKVVRLHGKAITLTSLSFVLWKKGQDEARRRKRTEEVEEGNVPGDKFSEAKPQVLRSRNGSPKSLENTI